MQETEFNYTMVILDSNNHSDIYINSVDQLWSTTSINNHSEKNEWNSLLYLLMIWRNVKLLFNQKRYVTYFQYTGRVAYGTHAHLDQGIRTSTINTASRCESVCAAITHKKFQNSIPSSQRVFVITSSTRASQECIIVSRPNYYGPHLQNEVLITYHCCVWDIEEN